MTRRVWIAIVLVVGIGAVIAFERFRDTSHLSLNSMPDGVADAWPLDRTWSWSFKLPPDMDDRTRIGLQVREKSSPLAPNSTPAIRFQSAAMPAGEAKRTLGTGWMTLTVRPRTGSAKVQLVDLGAIRVQPAKSGQNLLVLGSLRINGSRSDIAGDSVQLPAGRLAGHTVSNSGLWKDGELYLMTFYVRGEDQVWQYDVLLQRILDGPGH